MFLAVNDAVEMRELHNSLGQRSTTVFLLTDFCWFDETDNLTRFGNQEFRQMDDVFLFNVLTLSK